MSLGMRSGVNCTRLNRRSRTRARVLMRRVLARPGTPTRRQCPSEKSAVKSSSTTRSCPTITFWTSPRTRTRASLRSAIVRAASAVVISSGINAPSATYRPWKIARPPAPWRWLCPHPGCPSATMFPHLRLSPLWGVRRARRTNSVGYQPMPEREVPRRVTRVTANRPGFQARAQAKVALGHRRWYSSGSDSPQRGLSAEKRARALAGAPSVPRDEGKDSDPEADHG